MSFDLSAIKLPALNLDQFHLPAFDLSHIERMGHRVFPTLPAWFQSNTSIWAVYAILVAILLCTLLSYYSTFEALFLGSGRSSMSRPNVGFLLAVDAFFTLIAYQILTA